MLTPSQYGIALGAIVAARLIQHVLGAVTSKVAYDRMQAKLAKVHSKAGYRDIPRV